MKTTTETKMNKTMTQIATSHFGRKAVSALRAKGIAIIGLCTIPGAGPLPYANSQTGYQVSDNGTGKVWTYLEVSAAVRS